MSGKRNQSSKVIRELLEKVKLSGSESELNSIATHYKNITYQGVHSREDYYTGENVFGRAIGKNEWNLLFVDDAPPRRGKILNVGCGFGSLELWGLDHGYECYGIEPDPVAAAIASKLLSLNSFHSNQYIFQEYGEKIHFRNNQFDVVASLSALEHVFQPMRVIDEMLRVLRPGGLLVIVCPNYASFWEFHYSLPWLPIFSKSAAKFYVRLVRRRPGFIDKINFIKPNLFKKYFETKNIKFKDKSDELMYLMIQGKGSIRHPFLRNIMKRTGEQLLKLISKLHAYPYIKFIVIKNLE